MSWGRYRPPWWTGPYADRVPVRRDQPAVLLDLDGTLVDSRPGIVSGMNATLRAHGLAERTAAELEAHIGPPIHETFAALFDVAPGDPRLDVLVAGYRERYAGGMLAGTLVFDGVLAALDDLQAAGYALAIATSKAGPLAVALADGLQLAGLMSAIVGPIPPARDDKATTIGMALAALRTPSRAVMVGDRRHDIEGAHAHGLPAIGALWGIGDRAELITAGADALCASPRALASTVHELLPVR